MKKPKLRLDKAAIQEFFVENVEKIVFGLVVLVFLFFVYSAICGVGHYGSTPEQLKDKVATGDRSLASTQPTVPAVRDYDLQVKQNSVPIAAKPYGSLANWDAAVFSNRELRGPPALFAVQKLRGTPGFGAVPMTTDEPTNAPGQLAAAPAAGVQGQRWIVLTGLVPYDRELLAFEDALKNAGPPNSYSAERDTPYYIGYDVQRIEVNSPADAAKPNWDKAPTIHSGKAIKDATSHWSQPASVDVVGPEHLFPNKPEALVFPLAPLSGSKWGESAAHSPEIPLLDPGQAGAAGGGMSPRTPGNTPAPRPNGPMRPGSAPPGGTNPGGGDDYGEDSPNPATAPPPQPTGQPGDSPTATSTYLLFRFVDFDVQPGKQYIYRVQLVLRNPNYEKSDVKRAWLKDPALADQRYLKTKWSDEDDPAPVVAVPADTRVLLVSVTPRSAREPVGKILVSKWSKKYGHETHKEFEVARGQVLDYPGEIATRPEVLAAATGPATPPPLRPTPGGPGQSPRRPEPGQTPRPGMPGITGGPGSAGGGRGMMPPNGPRTPPIGPRTPPVGPVRPPTAAEASQSFLVNYLTHDTIVDFCGGELLRGPQRGSLHLSAPGYMLLQDRDGNLVVRDELDDLPAYKELVPTQPPATTHEHAPKAGQPGRPGPHGEAPKPPGGGRSRRPGGGGRPGTGPQP